ncbi:MAG: molybdopterin-dependent oxidoreductase [Pseudomonadota bacterium]|nr:molybdopterin-dependent oxidoreductase [Pseudomonadota bacterium]
MQPAQPETQPTAVWQKTACILCSINCGLEVQTGGSDGRQILKIRGDDDHPLSKGYLCEKSQRLNYYQQGADRLTTPMRRRADGSYEAVDWDTAIREVAARLLAVKAKYGGDSILYYGGGGQGNHLGGGYGDATLKALGVKYRSNALAQEKTGEFWVQGKMFGTGAHGDYHHCEVAVFVGKNPWQSHGFAQTRVLLKAIQNDPKRAMIVIDPRLSETAAMAEFHLQVKPATDAWCLAALSAIIIQNNWIKADWIAQHTTGYADIAPLFGQIDTAQYAEICGVPHAKLVAAAQRIAQASSVSIFEDLGVQMNQFSTLNSYLQRILATITGNYGKAGTANAFVPFFSLAKASKGEAMGKTAKQPAPTTPSNPKPKGRVSPVTGSKIIIGLLPCNVIPDEILTDHPKRFRAMIIESGNPAHSLADSQRMREAIRALEFSLVIDVAMTETARQADYVLPAASQFEKAEATFFNIEFPKNAFHLRQPLFAPLAGTLPEAEIHARLLEAMGELSEADYRPLRRALQLDQLRIGQRSLGSRSLFKEPLARKAFALMFAAQAARNKKTIAYAPVILYRTLGQTLPKGMEAAALVWALSIFHVMDNPKTAARCGFGGFAPLAGDRLFQALLDQPSGVVYAERTHAESWQAIARPEHRITLTIPELMPDIQALNQTQPVHDAAYPFILSAGERRADTANTAIRDASWHKRGRFGTLRIHAADAAALGCQDGDWVQVVTPRGAVRAPLEVSKMMQQGHISLPNGQGLEYIGNDGQITQVGVAPNELTDTARRDAFAGTPWHKCVPARLEKVA